MKCRFCGCTEKRARRVQDTVALERAGDNKLVLAMVAPTGCSWVESDLCSVCAQLKTRLRKYMLTAHSSSQTSMRRMYKELVL